MIVVTGSVTAREDSFHEACGLSLQHVDRSARSQNALRTPCISIAKIRCRRCSSSSGPVAPRWQHISWCRPHAILSAPFSRWPRPAL